ncbi:MAG: YggT family protein [Chloroflexi bacterium]|nr:YggT family protein [Chloroflexota bacterium]
MLSLLISWTRSGPGHPADLLVYMFVLYLCRILSIAVLVRAALSWFMVGGYNVFVFLLDDLTEPVMRPLRRVIPLVGRADLSPAVAILLLALAPFLLGLILGVR